MMDWSDRHCRYFWRLLSRHARLYTEMVTSGALIHGDRPRFLQFHEAEHPVALQLGGSDPQELAQCAKMAEDAGFDEVNLNCGCPSDRVQEGRIGACLMAEPELVGDCVNAMQHQVSIPITVKHRTGIDNQDSAEHLQHFVAKVAASGCTTFIVHARKAWLSGLSPKQNREVPPLNYDMVTALKTQFPHLTFVVNGGIRDLNASQSLLEQLDGVMLGREAYHNPYVLNEVDKLLFDGDSASENRYQIMRQYADYCKQQLSSGVRLHHLTRHILGIFAGQPGGRLFRQHLSTYAPRRNSGIEVLEDAVQLQMQMHQSWLDRQAV